MGRDRGLRKESDIHSLFPLSSLHLTRNQREGRKRGRVVHNEHQKLTIAPPHDKISTLIVPAFYALLRADDANAQSQSTSDLQTHITSLVLAADSEGPLFAGPGGDLCLVDVHFAPFAVRLSRVLKPARGWTDPVPGTRWNRWLDALETNAHLKATMSADGLYTDTMDVLLQEQDQEQRQG